MRGSAGGLAARACAWLGEWVRRAPPAWSGPPEVIIHARRIVIALRDGDPIDVAAPPSRRIALRIAPSESPPASLHEEVDDGRVVVEDTIYVPPSLALLDQ